MQAMMWKHTAAYYAGQWRLWWCTRRSKRNACVLCSIPHEMQQTKRTRLASYDGGWTIKKKLPKMHVCWDVTTHPWVSSPRLLDHEKEGTMILQNVKNYCPSNTVSHPRTESSAIPLKKTFNLTCCINPDANGMHRNPKWDRSINS